MGLIPELGVDELTGILLLVLEALAIALVALAVLGVRHRRATRELQQARRLMRRGNASQASHKAFVKKAHEELHGLFQRLGVAEADNAVEATLEADATPRQILLRLWKSLLALEARTLSLSQAEIWQDRTEALARHLRGWRRALELLPTSIATAQPSAPAETQERPPAEGKLHAEIRQLRSRVGELQAYKQHFSELHGHALEERRANRELRIQLNHALVNAQPPQALQQALKDYEGRRGGVDGFLDRADVHPLAERTAAPASGAQGPAVSTRQQAVIDESGGRVEREYRNLQSTINQQRHLIGELKDKLAQAEFDREQLRQYYVTRVQKLERNNEQTQQSLTVLETENARQHRQVRRLTRKLKEQRNLAADREALEATIDRFATQALDMQSRIGALEAELAELETDSLRSDPESGLPAEPEAGPEEPTDRS